MTEFRAELLPQDKVAAVEDLVRRYAQLERRRRQLDAEAGGLRRQVTSLLALEPGATLALPEGTVSLSRGMDEDMLVWTPRKSDQDGRGPAPEASPPDSPPSA